MEYRPSEVQTDLIDGLARILRDMAGPARATAICSTGGYDTDLHAALTSAGFLSVAREPELGPLEAALVAEAAAESAAVVASSTAALVVPSILPTDIDGPVALTVADGDTRFVRFAAHAKALLGIYHDEAMLVVPLPGEVVPVRSTFGVPVGRVPFGIWERGQSLGHGSADRLVRWWRVSIAVEQVGLMSGALNLTVEYLNNRIQFGRPIASFQAVQHRMAECAVLVEGARWLAREAAALGAPAQAAAAACTHATVAGHQVAAECHQLTGAIGFTKEHPLHAYTTRLRGLGLDLGGSDGHARAVAAARWTSNPQ